MRLERVRSYHALQFCLLLKNGLSVMFLHAVDPAGDADARDQVACWVRAKSSMLRLLGSESIFLDAFISSSMYTGTC